MVDYVFFAVGRAHRRGKIDHYRRQGHASCVQEKEGKGEEGCSERESKTVGVHKRVRKET